MLMGSTLKWLADEFQKPSDFWSFSTWILGLRRFSTFSLSIAKLSLRSLVGDVRTVVMTLAKGIPNGTFSFTKSLPGEEN